MDCKCVVQHNFVCLVTITKVEFPGEKNAEVCDANELNRKPPPSLRGGEGGLGFRGNRAGDSWARRERKEIYPSLLIFVLTK